MCPTTFSIDILDLISGENLISGTISYVNQLTSLKHFYLGGNKQLKFDIASIKAWGNIRSLMLTVHDPNLSNCLQSVCYIQDTNTIGQFENSIFSNLTSLKWFLMVSIDKHLMWYTLKSTLCRPRLLCLESYPLALGKPPRRWSTSMCQAVGTAWTCTANG